MIDLDFTNPVDAVRATIGDPNSEFVTDSTILSALSVYNSVVLTASLAIMELLCTKFATLADKEKLGELEVYYTKQFERYRQRIIDIKSGDAGSVVPTSKAFMPIIIAGTSKAEKYARVTDDSFTMYEQADWHERMLERYPSLYEQIMIGEVHTHGID